MSGNGNQVPLAPSQRGPGQYPRTSTPHRAVDCYHPTAAGGGSFMQNAAGGAQSTQATLRVQPTPQPSAPPAPQQDMSKSSMTGHNFVSQNQTPQPRPQYQNFQFRAAQHGTRPNTHTRQQPPYIPGSATATTGPVMYPVVFQPHMGLQTYQTPRSSTPYHYHHQYVSYIPGYNTPPSHTPQYFYTPNSQQLSTQNTPANGPGRSNPTTLVGPQNAQETPAAPNATMPHPQAAAHLHQAMPGIRTPVQKRSRRIPIINPETQQEVFSEGSNDNYLSGDSSDRQTPQPEPAHSVIEEFSRKINEVANQPCESALKLSYVSKNVEMTVPVMTTTSSMQSQPNAISSININNNNNNILKSDILNINDIKILGPDVAEKASEPPVVSAISDSPVIVPKMPMNNKQLQKNSDHNVQSLVLDTIKNIPPNKQLKNKNVPQVEELVKHSDIISCKINTILSSNTCTGIPLNTQVQQPFVATPFHGSTQTSPSTQLVSLSGASTQFMDTTPFVAPLPPTSVVAITPASVVSLTPAPAPAPVPAPLPPMPALTTSTHAPSPSPAPVPTSTLAPLTAAPLPQQTRESIENKKSEEKEISNKHDVSEKDVETAPSKPNGPTLTMAFSSENISDVVNPSTSQKQQKAIQTAIQRTPETPELEKSVLEESRLEILNKKDCVPELLPTATELLSASIEKLAKEILDQKDIEVKEASSAIEAQVKLTQSLSSVLRTNQPETKMKDINLNNKSTDPDAANGNTPEVNKTVPAKEDVNKNEKTVKNTKNANKKSANKTAKNETNVKVTESYENGKDETDKVVNVDKQSFGAQDEIPEKSAPAEETDAIPAVAPVFVPKYKYGEDQWSPLNKSGRKCYDIGLLKQIKDDPLSRNKPNVPLLEACNIMRSTPLQEPQCFTPISRPNDTSFYPFAKPVIGSRSNTARDAKKDARNLTPSGKGSAKLVASSSGSSSHNKPHIIHVSLSLREEVKLSEVDSAWKPTRFRKENMTEEDYKTQELYKKFRGILNKLTPEKFDTLLDRVKTLEINNQKRLEGVIDLVFEKAIDEPNFSVAYAAMCNKLSTLKVPADNPTNPDQCVNFRALIINKCQNQFETDKVDEQVLKLEKELEECTDPTKKKELHLMLEEENRRVRMRSVGNVRFIGELYKLKMLTCKIMDYCMKYLIDKVEEEKLECLCKLLTTIGEQVENETTSQLDNIFKKMQDIVDRKSNKISSRVRFMIQDVIELRKRKWVVKSVVDSQPKTMNQIQKEAEQQQRHIELMNANPMGGNFRREEGGGGGRNKRGDNRRQNSNNSFMDSTWKTTRPNYSVDTSKLKAVTQKNLSNIKLAPHISAWNHGSGTKNTAQTASNSMISLSKNMYSVLENVQTDPISIRANRDVTPTYHSKGASIERSTFNSRSDFGGNTGRSGSVGVARSNSGTRSTSAEAPLPSSMVSAPSSGSEASAPPPTVEPAEQMPLDKAVKDLIDKYLHNHEEEEATSKAKTQFLAQDHAVVVGEIFNIALQKAPKDVALIAKLLMQFVSMGIITPENLLAGMRETFEIAPDLHIDIPMLYEFLGKFVAPHIEKKHITFAQIFKLCEVIISFKHGHLFLKAVMKEMIESMGPTFVKNKWLESEMQLSDWIRGVQVSKWLEDNKFEFLEGCVNTNEDAKILLSPAETQSKLLQLMNSDENCECIKGWAQDKFGKSSNEDWFMRALIQAICEHALFGSDTRDVPHFNQDRMNKYASLIHEFGETKQSREASCLFGIQKLIHRLEHPQGITLDIFQFLHDQYIISLDGFIEWELSEKEPEGKGVMMKALTSFFTNIKEADNEDSCSED
ncbi:hypothetical protein K1T71_000263 [Dendrolimus kikuchii]|uniref:Uncharacterized protein n=1 Tax=Dendrolimus kikuchii TaxID=765133 RepID=A0ACC1DIV8_9NEOP|nr:hypothetical protein K1T71_000263 [Dendrolimus kikuchii]